MFSWLQCSDSDNNMGMCSVGYSLVTLITIWEYVQLVTVALITIWTVFSWLECSGSDNNMGICSVGYRLVTLITIWECVQLVTG